MGIHVNRRSRGSLAVWVFLLSSLSSCSSSKNERPLFPVRGKVLFEEGPAAKALVIFHSVHDPGPDAVKPRAIVGPDGSFQAFTYVAGDGVSAGEYVVTIVGEKGRRLTKQTLSPAKKKKQEIPVRLLPVHYEDPKTSELRAQVQEGPNELPPFHLKKD